MSLSAVLCFLLLLVLVFYTLFSEHKSNKIRQKADLTVLHYYEIMIAKEENK